jgi:hypothetical protein
MTQKVVKRFIERDLISRYDLPEKPCISLIGSTLSHVNRLPGNQ